MVKQEDAFFRSDNSAIAWQRYCGFLSLSAEEFSLIQESLFQEQIEKVFNKPTFRDLMQAENISNINDFRQAIPLRRYSDFERYFRNDETDLSSEGAYHWVHTSASRGTFKKMLWSKPFQDIQCRNVISSLILSAAREQGDVNMSPGCKVMNLLPGRPFVSASIAFGIQELFSVKSIPVLESSEELSFTRKIDAAIMQGLASDVDFVIAMTSSLLRIGPRFENLWKKVNRNPKILLTLHPKVAWRLLRNSGTNNTFPKNAWQAKGIVCWGVDSTVLSTTVERQWGKKPLQLFGSTEGGIMAMQDWQKGPMAFVPDSVFFEFIPEESINKANPPTLLINELENGKSYELVITSFHGMPLIRYRQGDLLKIQRDNEQSVPRMTFVGRADNTIDLFGIARLNPEVLNEALGKVGISNQRWCVRKEYETDRMFLRFYLENDSEALSPADLEKGINQSLKSTDSHWAEAVYTMAYNPVRVTVVPLGTFTNLSPNDGFKQINPPEPFIQKLTHLREEKVWTST